MPTTARDQMVDVTAQLRDELARSGMDDGYCRVYVPHTTCGVTVNEGADPDVQADYLAFLRRLVPPDGDWRHAEGNSDSHVKAMLTGTSVTVPVEGGRLRLGRWQAVFLCEFDGPRERSLWVSFQR